MRVKVDYRTGGKEAYKSFCKKHPEIKLSCNEWVQIVYGFNEDFRNYILETGDVAKLPYGVGPFFINKKKRKTKKVTPDGREFINLPIDWVKTREKGKHIYLMNYHTEGYFFGWCWDKKAARFRFSSLWRFKPSRVSSRMLAHYIKTDNKYQHIYKQWFH
jgi:hypothetical protein